MNAAVLFLVFNRPDTTRRVFEAIRAARPSRLYVAADGPRASRPDEAARCTLVRQIATAVDWPCEVKTLFRDENLGCRHGVSGGIDWFFDQEEEGIILEDDVLPQPSFFPYCEALLSRYRNDASVSMISGCNLLGPSHQAAASYFFSRYMHIWGWASWRRAWTHYDVDMGGWPGSESAAKLDRLLGGRKNAIRYWAKIFDRVQGGEIDTWDYQWLFAAWMNDMVAVIPSHNLVENLGFGADATHTTGAVPAAVLAASASDIVFPLRDPVRGPTGPVDAEIERSVLEITALMQAKTTFRQLPLVRHLASIYRNATH